MFFQPIGRLNVPYADLPGMLVDETIHANIAPRLTPMDIY